MKRIDAKTRSEPERFAAYALDASAKFIPGSEPTLSANRLKLLKRAFRPILPLIRDARRILDFGCGAGDLLAFLDQHTSASLIGFDPSSSQIDVARTRVHGLQSVHLVDDLQQLMGPYDLVFSLHVVEHVPDDALGAYAVSLVQHLSPCGRVVLSTPNGLNPLAYAYFMSTDKTHMRMHSAFTLNEIFRPLGYEVEQIHRETPQIYDLPTFAKTAVWWCYGQVLRLGVYATAGGVRGLRFPLMMAPTLYFVIARSPRVGDSPQ